MAVVPFIPLGIPVGLGVLPRCGGLPGSGPAAVTVAQALPPRRLAARPGRAGAVDPSERPPRVPSAGRRARWSAPRRGRGEGGPGERRGMGTVGIGTAGLDTAGLGTVGVGAVRIGRGRTTGKPPLVAQGRRGPARERRFPRSRSPRVGSALFRCSRAARCACRKASAVAVNAPWSYRRSARLPTWMPRNVGSRRGPRASRTVAAGVPAAWTTMLSSAWPPRSPTALQVAVAGQLRGVRLRFLPDSCEPVGGRNAVEVDHGTPELDHDRCLGCPGVVHGDRSVLASGQAHHRVDRVGSHGPSFVPSLPRRLDMRLSIRTSRPAALVHGRL